MGKRKQRSKSRKKPSPVPALPAGIEDDHAQTLVERLAERVEALLNVPVSEEGYLPGVLRVMRGALACESHFLVSKPALGKEKRPTVIDSNIDPHSHKWQHLSKRLPKLFRSTIGAEDGTWGQDITSGDKPDLIPAAASVQLQAVDRDDKTLTLLLAMCERTAPPEPEFPTALYRTYDQTTLRLWLLFIAQYLRYEYWDRIEAYDQSQELSQVSARLPTAQRVIEFNNLIGVDTDLSVVAGWLEAEKQTFLAGDRRTVDFEASLKMAG